jgi:hypothetical protein
MAADDQARTKNDMAAEWAAALERGSKTAPEVASERPVPRGRDHGAGLFTNFCRAARPPAPATTST